MRRRLPLAEGVPVLIDEVVPQLVSEREASAGGVGLFDTVEVAVDVEASPVTLEQPVEGVFVGTEA